MFLQFHFYLFTLVTIGSAATGLGAGGIAANSGAGQGGLGSIHAADQLAAHGAWDFGTATSGMFNFLVAMHVEHLNGEKNYDEKCATFLCTQLINILF